MSDDRWNSEDPEHPYIDRGPRLPRVKPAAGPLVTPDEIFGWLTTTFGPDPKPPAPRTEPPGPDLTQAKALAVEFPFSPEECERVLIVAKRDETLARQLLHRAASINRRHGPDAIGEVCFSISELKKGSSAP